jgi:ribosomal protein L11 methyltransferase
MYIWRRSATAAWWNINRHELENVAANRLAIIERANRKRLQIEIASESDAECRRLVRRFGGRTTRLPRDWLKRLQKRRTKPIRIGKSELIIPAGAAFGTGDHATTAMCLQLLERLAAKLKLGWTAIDLGTGSGILALAARRLGAGRVIGIDNDALAISTAKQNGRTNKLAGVQFRVADVRQWKLPPVNVVTANLFSELLIETIPKLKRSDWLILSGILGEQEDDVVRALRRNRREIVELRHRAKWVAILAGTAEKRFAPEGRGS